jgi:hypothetical protein
MRRFGPLTAFLVAQHVPLMHQFSGFPFRPRVIALVWLNFSWLLPFLPSYFADSDDLGQVNGSMLMFNIFSRLILIRASTLHGS